MTTWWNAGDGAMVDVTPTPPSLFCFDLDGTLIESFLEEDECPICEGQKVYYDGVREHPCDACHGQGHKLVQKDAQSYDDIRWLPGRFERIRQVVGLVHSPRFCLVTNQTGASYGFQTPEQIDRKLQAVTKKFHEEVWLPLHVYAARHYNERELRKPAPGLIIQAMQDANAQPWSTLMVGDLITDLEAAERAGAAFQWADSFFKP